MSMDLAIHIQSFLRYHCIDSAIERIHRVEHSWINILKQKKVTINRKLR